ncbi:MAG: hypothetical protein ACI33I_11155, partial [Clostridium sp.]
MRILKKKWCALLIAISVITSILPTTKTLGIVNSEDKKFEDKQTVHVGFIKEGERSIIFNQDWKFYKGDQSGAEA